MKIGSFDLNDKVFVIAEIGNNHEGDFGLAEELIGLAARAGVDAVKFQTIVPERLVAGSQTERLARLRKFQLSYAQYEKLAATAKNHGVVFLSTPFDLESALFLDKIVPAFKIASGDNNFFPLIEFVAGTGKPLIVSSGFLETTEIRHLRDFVRGVWERNRILQELCILHCMARYPTPPENARLAMIEEIARLGVVPGYSDHTLGVEAAVLSVALGARVIEKHFTKDKNFSDFRDHSLSADPAEMAELVRRVRQAEKMIAVEGARVDKQNENDARRSVTAARALKSGQTLSAEDLTWLRPGGGMKPGEETALMGTDLARDMAQGEKIRFADVRPSTKKGKA